MRPLCSFMLYLFTLSFILNPNICQLLLWLGYFNWSPCQYILYFCILSFIFIPSFDQLLFVAGMFQLAPLPIYFVLRYFILFYSIYPSASTFIFHPLFWFPLSISFFLLLGYFNFTLNFIPYLNSIHLPASSYGWAISTSTSTFSFILIPSASSYGWDISTPPSTRSYTLSSALSSGYHPTIYPITHHR